MAPETQIHQLVPELGAAETVDMPCQIVEITPLDELSRNGRAHRSAGGLTGYFPRFQDTVITPAAMGTAGPARDWGTRRGGRPGRPAG
jgi:hypothetical protein